MLSKLPEIIGLVGPIRAGKTTASKYLVERYGYVSASNSDILKKILEGMNIPVTRSNLASLGNSLFEILGNDLIAKHRLENLHLGRIVVDGIRYPDEIKRYMSVPSFRLLGITADATIRFERTVNAEEKLKDANISQAEFECIAESRSELEVPELVAKADETICNLETVEKFKSRIDEIINKWSL